MCAKHYENPTMLSKVTAKNVTSIKSNQIYLRQKKEHNATQKKQSKYVDRTQRQYETALTSALQNKKKHYNRNLSSTILLLKQATVGEVTI